MDSAVQDWLHRYGSKPLHEKFQRLRAFPQHRNRVGYPDLKGAFLEAGFTVQDVALVTQFGEPRAGVQWDALLAQIGTALQQIGAVPAAGTARRDTSQEGPLRGDNEGRYPPATGTGRFDAQGEKLEKHKSFLEKLRRYDKERRCVVPAAAISCVLHDMRCAEADVKECFSYMFPQDRNFVNIEPLIKFLAGASGGSDQKDHSVSGQTVQKLQAGAGENGAPSSSRQFVHGTKPLTASKLASVEAVAAGAVRPGGKVKSPSEMSAAPSSVLTTSGAELRRSYQLWTEGRLSTDQLIDDLKEHGVSSHAVEEKLRQNDFARGLTFAQIRTLSGIGRGEKFHDGPKKHRPCFQKTDTHTKLRRGKIQLGGRFDRWETHSVERPCYSWNCGEVTGTAEVTGKIVDPTFSRNLFEEHAADTSPVFGDSTRQVNEQLLFPRSERSTGSTDPTVVTRSSRTRLGSGGVAEHFGGDAFVPSSSSSSSSNQGQGGCSGEQNAHTMDESRCDPRTRKHFAPSPTSVLPNGERVERELECPIRGRVHFPERTGGRNDGDRWVSHPERQHFGDPVRKESFPFPSIQPEPPGKRSDSSDMATHGGEGHAVPESYAVLAPEQPYGKPAMPPVWDRTAHAFCPGVDRSPSGKKPADGHEVSSADRPYGRDVDGQALRPFWLANQHGFNEEKGEYGANDLEPQGQQQQGRQQQGQYLGTTSTTGDDFWSGQARMPKRDLFAPSAEMTEGGGNSTSTGARVPKRQDLLRSHFTLGDADREGVGEGSVSVEETSSEARIFGNRRRLLPERNICTQETHDWSHAESDGAPYPGGRSLAASSQKFSYPPPSQAPQSYYMSRNVREGNYGEDELSTRDRRKALTVILKNWVANYAHDDDFLQAWRHSLASFPPGVVSFEDCKQAFRPMLGRREGASDIENLFELLNPDPRGPGVTRERAHELLQQAVTPLI